MSWRGKGGGGVAGRGACSNTGLVPTQRCPVYVEVVLTVFVLDQNQIC